MSLLGFLDFLQIHSLGLIFTVVIATAAAWWMADNL